MRTIEIVLYKFEELSKRLQKEVIEKNADINVEHEWWDFIYDDAKVIGFDITGFDLHRREMNLVLVNTYYETALAILEAHGEGCKTYELAKKFITDYDSLVEKHSDGVKKDIVAEENEIDFDDEADELEANYHRSIGDEYLRMLTDQYDYLTGDEAIKETLIANDYEFTEEAEIY